MVAKNLLDDVFALPMSDRVELFERLRDNLQAESDAFPLTDAQRVELDRRAAEMKADPAARIRWEEVKARVWPKRG